MSEAFGRYRIVGELGRGAMGAVYRALDPLIEREVAIKTLLPSLPGEIMAEVRERFLREARSAGRLSHPNIVTVFDVGEQDGVAYIAMELVEGRSLQEILRDPQPLPVAEAAEIAAQVADALEHARQFSIVHRDVKPGNVMVAPSGRCKLTDFGVAYMPSSTMTQTGATIGSPRYMSPEQVLGQKIDPRADLFSLGVVLYEMLTRRAPFERPGDQTPFAIMSRIAGEPHPPLRSIDPRIPEAFERILSQALAKKPEHRYATAGEMARDLRQALSARAPATAYDTTLPVKRAAPAAAAFPNITGNLMNDLDAFARRLDAEEEEARRRAAEDEERQRRAQAEAARLREAEEARKRAEAAAKAAADAASSARRAGGALDMLRKQTPAAPILSPIEIRERGMAALDKALRDANRYFGEFAIEVRSVRPASGRPYPLQFLGTVPVTLTDARSDSRPRTIGKQDYLDYTTLRFDVLAFPAAKLTITGDDVARFEAWLKGLKAAYEFQVTARNDFGQAKRAAFTVTGPFPCEVVLRGDYDALAVNVELAGVRQVGTVTCRVELAALEQAVDELCRYILGADDEFAARLPARR